QLTHWSDYLPWVRVVAAIIVIGMLRTTPARARLMQVALGLVLGGALGNIYDGFTVGKVRDFLMVDFGFKPFAPFPIFNVADSAICVGVGLLALSMARDRPEAAVAALRGRVPPRAEHAARPPRGRGARRPRAARLSARAAAIGETAASAIMAA